MPLRPRLDGFLRARARALLAPRRALLDPVAQARAALRAALDRADHAARAAARAAAALERDLAIFDSPRFRPDMTIDQAWRRHPGVRAVFARRHLPACDACAVRFDETLAEAALAYDLDLDALLAELDATLGTSPLPSGYDAQARTNDPTSLRPLEP